MKRTTHELHKPVNLTSSLQMWPEVRSQKPELRPQRPECAKRSPLPLTDAESSLGGISSADIRHVERGKVGAC
jgi:hypothetical protein